MGYAFTISQNGQWKRGGGNGYVALKRDDATIQDAVGLAQGENVRQNIASVTKPLTAVTVLKILQDKLTKGDASLTIGSKVLPYLPATWAKGKDVDTLTFRELMSQYSGMNDNGGGTGVAALQKWIADGANRPKSDYKYINANLAIFRVIIPYMLAEQATRDKWDALAKDDPDAFNKIVSGKYVEHVNSLVLQPAGIAPASCYPTSRTPALLYNNPDNEAPGFNPGDWTPSAGGGGWYLSSAELARVMAFVRFTDKILNNNSRLLMNGSYLGWMTPDVWGNFKGAYGVYYGHRGTSATRAPASLSACTAPS
jgi:CubicO group peptidase (beta-lactamase class C family)